MHEIVATSALRSHERYPCGVAYRDSLHLHAFSFVVLTHSEYLYVRKGFVLVLLRNVDGEA